MLKRPRSDFWQVGLIPCPVDQLSPERMVELRHRVTWLPDAGPWRYLADPFGLLHRGQLHVFVEAYDYRTKRAHIERHVLDPHTLTWQGHTVSLVQPCHLSYPLVFTHEGEVCMIPESHQAGEVALYRARRSLDNWERVTPLLSGLPAADATVIQHEGRWWMFYALVGPQARDQRELHVAWAPALTGPWTPLAHNPVHVDRAGARPAGHAFHRADGRLVLPVQDSSRTYGGATRWLTFEHLSPERVVAHLSPERFTGDLLRADHAEGCHTLSACGEFTCVDVKRMDRSRYRHWLDWQRRWRRLTQRR